MNTSGRGRKEGANSLKWRPSALIHRRLAAYANSRPSPDVAKVDTPLLVEYLGEQYPVTVAVAGSTPPFDPDNTRIRS